jgi:hypothetical protein
MPLKGPPPRRAIASPVCTFGRDLVPMLLSMPRKPHLRLHVQPMPHYGLLWSVWTTFPALRDPREFPLTRLHASSGAAITEAGAR